MKKLDLRVLIIALVAGVAAGAAELMLYGALSDTMGKPMMIGLMMLLFALIMAVVITVVVCVSGSSGNCLWFLESRGVLVIATVLALALVFAAGMGLEWVYDRTEITTDIGDAYIFLIDESGSITQSDPSGERYAAVNALMSSTPDNVPYMVYMFDDKCVKIRDLAPHSAGAVVRPADADTTMLGLTFVEGALETVYQDLMNSSDQTVTPHVILLCDGSANDLQPGQASAVLDNYANSGISISTVSLYFANDALLQEIADKTGGGYVHVSDASQLSQGFGSITNVLSERDLLSARDLAEKDGQYMLLRILFLTLLGVLIALVKAFASGDEDSFPWIMAVGSGCALLGALIVEFGLKLGLPVWLCQLLYWILLSITPHFTRVARVNASHGQGEINHASARGMNPHETTKSKRSKPGSSSGSSGSSSSGGHRSVDWNRK